MANSHGGFSLTGVVPDNCVGTLSDGTTTTQVLVRDCTPAKAKPNRVVNGGFETGDLTGWSTIGDVSVQPSSFGDIPVQGKFQALITNAPLFTPLACSGDPQVCGPGNPDMPLSFSGNYGGDFSHDGLCALFDAPFGSPFCNELNSAGFFDQSGIKQTFTTKSPGFLTFRWNFLTDETFPFPSGEPGFFDSAMLILDGTVLFLRPDGIGGPAPSFSSSSSVFLWETGYQVAVVPVTPGTHTFGFGIVDFLDPLIASGLLVDDIRFIPGHQGAGTN